MEGNLVQIVPFLDYAISLLAVVITAVVTVVGKKLNDRFKLEIEFRHREVLQETLTHGVLLAINRVRALYKDSPPIHLRNQVVATALQYVIQAVPDALKKFGIDPSTEAGQKRIIEMVEIRLDTRFFDHDKKEGEVVELHSVEKKDD